MEAEKITYLRAGRKVRASGTVIDRHPTGEVKVKPDRPDWGCIWLTQDEIDAGAVKPPIIPRKKAEDDGTGMVFMRSDRRPRKKKPAPKPDWQQAVDDGREFLSRNAGDALLTGACRIIERLSGQLERSALLFSPPTHA
jgi:hypothetical protein